MLRGSLRTLRSYRTINCALASVLPAMIERLPKGMCAHCAVESMS